MALAQKAYGGLQQFATALRGFEDPLHVPTSGELVSLERDAALLAMVLSSRRSRAMPHAAWVNLSTATDLRDEMRSVAYIADPPPESMAGRELAVLRARGAALTEAAWEQYGELEKAVAAQMNEAHLLARRIVVAPGRLRRRAKFAYRRIARSLPPTRPSRYR
jgi:hypothetical protein